MVTGGPPLPPFIDDDPAFTLDQLDGNVTLNSSMHTTVNQCDSDLNLYIPIQLGLRPAKVIIERPPSSRKTIRRDNKKVQALTLPKIANFNVRSLFPKIGNFQK